jgi:phosphoglycerol geranylgeranyltransferase
MGKVESYILQKIASKGSIHFTLIDPDKVQPSQAVQIAAKLETLGTSAIMIGGSTVVSVSQLDEVVKKVQKTVQIPVILFPNHITGISQYADAILFMSLLNSDNPLFISGIQALGAPLIKRYDLETLPLGYIIIDSGSTAAYIGQARALPRDKPEIAASFALAAQYLGMRFVYLEAGSGAKNPVPYEMISYVKDVIDIPLIVGGGIKTGEVAQNIVKSGADVIVTGTIIEYMQQEQDISSIIAAIHNEALI